MLTVLSGIAEFERSLIPAKDNEGRARAMAKAYDLAGSRS
jgi:DNA invertase Pin-like site-specific DNA recombinase